METYRKIILKKNTECLKCKNNNLANSFIYDYDYNEGQRQTILAFNNKPHNSEIVNRTTANKNNQLASKNSK